MQTVESLISSIYGDENNAASKLGVGRTAVSNWKTWGYFPTRLIVPLCKDAREKGIELDVAKIPTTRPKGRAA